MPADLTSRIAEIAGRAEAATPGEWFSAGGYVTVRDPEKSSFSNTIFHLDELGQVGGSSPFQAVPFARATDAAFVANAKQDIPALLRLVAVLREQRNSWIADLSTSDRAEKESIKLADAAALAALEGE